VVTHGNTPSTPPRLHPTLLQRFGATLRQYRQQRGLTQKALATSIGIRRSSYLSEIELGKRNITVLTLLHLAWALDIPAARLLAGLDTDAPRAPLTPYDPLSSRGTRDATPSVTPSPQPDDATPLLQLLGTTLRHYRQHVGLSQPALAARTGLNPTYIGQIEQGQRNVSVLSLLRIAEALGISLSSLLTPLETR
jgi:transcriptional regulator with XRE-family HTH domain